MPYAQKNYNELQGLATPSHPLKYSIRQVGCFLTSFCNLLERFGKPVDPLTLNRIFAQRGIWIDVDDGVRDDLGWQSITAYDGSIIVRQTGIGGLPPHANAILRFSYKGGYHFCLAVNLNDHTILDSYDGVVKNWSLYGSPNAWATYDHIQPQPVQPIAPPAPKVDTRFEDIPAQDFVVNKNPTSLWNLNAKTWGDFKPIENWNAGTRFTARAKFHHPLGGTYYTKTNGDMAGINVVDAAIAPPQAPPPIIPEPAKAEVKVEATPEQKVEVKVTPTDPNAWKNNKDVSVKGFYSAIKDGTVKDFDGLLMDKMIYKGQGVYIDYAFTKDKVKAYHPEKSKAKMYGILPEILEEDVPEDLNLANELREAIKNPSLRQRAIKWLANISASLERRSNKHKR